MEISQVGGVSTAPKGSGVGRNTHASTNSQGLWSASIACALESPHAIEKYLWSTALSWDVKRLMWGQPLSRNNSWTMSGQMHHSTSTFDRERGGMHFNIGYSRKVAGAKLDMPLVWEQNECTGDFHQLGRRVTTLVENISHGGPAVKVHSDHSTLQVWCPSFASQENSPKFKGMKWSWK